MLKYSRDLGGLLELLLPLRTGADALPRENIPTRFAGDNFTAMSIRVTAQDDLTVSQPDGPICTFGALKLFRGSALVLAKFRFPQPRGERAGELGLHRVFTVVVFGAW